MIPSPARAVLFPWRLPCCIPQEHAGHTSVLRLLPDFMSRHPNCWSRDDVQNWVKWCVTEYALPDINLDKFSMNGKALCVLTKEDFFDRVPNMGDVLYNTLQSLQPKPGVGLMSPGMAPLVCHVPTGNEAAPLNPPQLKSPRTIFPEVTKYPMGGSLLHPIYPKQPILPKPVLSPQVPEPSDEPIDMKIYPPVSTPLTPPLSINSDADTDGVPPPRQMELSSTEGAATMPEPDRCHDNHRSHALPSYPDSQCEYETDHHRERSVAAQYPDCKLLWEFISQLLMTSQDKTVVRWEDETRRIFKIVNPSQLAQLWGQRKNKSGMTYEKLSRALRYYYKMNIICKVPGKKLTYRFNRPPDQIQRGQRGAKRGVPHKPRLKTCPSNILPKGIPTSAMTPDMTMHTSGAFNQSASDSGSLCHYSQESPISSSTSSDHLKLLQESLEKNIGPVTEEDEDTKTCILRTGEGLENAARFCERKTDLDLEWRPLPIMVDAACVKAARPFPDHSRELVSDYDGSTDSCSS